MSYAQTDWRALCEELVEQLDDALDFTVSSETRRHMKLLTRRARTLLAQSEHEVGLTDQELADAFAEGCRYSSKSGEPPFLGGARAAIAADRARWGRPAPAPAGEVAELVAWLRSTGEGQPRLSDEGYARLTRAADLLERLANLAQEVWDLIGESHGVAGLHLNGDLAPWEELLPGGRFERLPSLPPASDTEVKP